MEFLFVEPAIGSDPKRVHTGSVDALRLPADFPRWRDTIWIVRQVYAVIQFDSIE
jgi:hypothetical protein